MPQLTIGLIASYLVEWLKNSQRFPWITANSTQVSRTVSALLAVVTSVGMQYTYDATTGTLTVTGLTLASVGMLVWEAVKQFAANEVAYKVAVK